RGWIAVRSTEACLCSLVIQVERRQVFGAEVRLFVLLRPMPAVEGVGEDTKEPGLEVGPALERAEAPVRQKRRVLDQILGLGPVAREAHGGAIGHMEDRAEQDLELGLKWDRGYRLTRGHDASSMTSSATNGGVLMSWTDRADRSRSSRAPRRSR